MRHDKMKVLARFGTKIRIHRMKGAPFPDVNHKRSRQAIARLHRALGY